MNEKDMKIVELSLDQLEGIAGGVWDRDTLTYDEWRRLDLLTTRMVDTAANGPASARKKCYAEFTDYVNMLEEKYGPSGWDWMAMILG